MESLLSDKYEADVFTIFRSSYILCRRDEWAESSTECIMVPTVSAVMEPWFSEVVAPTVGMFEEMVSCVSLLLRSATEQHASISALLLTMVHNRVVLLHGDTCNEVRHACAYSVPPSVFSSHGIMLLPSTTHQLERGTSMQEIGTMFHQVVNLLVGCAEAAPSVVYAGCSSNGVQAVPSFKLVSCGGTGAHIMPIASRVSLSGRPGWANPAANANLIAVVSRASGTVVRFVNAPVTPLYGHVYITLETEVVDTLPSTTAGICRFVNAMKAMATGVAADVEEQLVELTSLPLFEDVQRALRTVATMDDLSACMSRALSETNPVARVVAQRKVQDLTQVRDPVKRKAMQDALLADLGALQVPREADGLLFDMLLQGVSLEDVPPEWNPSSFYTAGDSGFLTVLYILQWRSTMHRFIELARLATLDADGTVLPALSSFRVGIMHSTTTAQSAHRVSPKGVHIFFFNPARESMNLCLEDGAEERKWEVAGSLQTQCAKVRDSVVAFFVAQAVALLAPLLQPVNASAAAAKLLGMYMGALQDKDLRHTYKDWQRMVRELRHTVPCKKRKFS